MAVNMKKHGYSTKEVGQIIGCNFQTVRNRIYAGKMKADILPGCGPGGRKLIRISREQLREYLMNNRDAFDKTLLDAFGIDDTSHVEQDKTDNSAMRSNRQKEVPTTAVPTGAWASLLDPKKETETTNEIRPAPTDEECKKYSVLINGRISVGNIKLETAMTIINTLTQDDSFVFDDIQLRRVTL